MNSWKFLWNWVPVIVYAAAIYYMSSIPILGLPGIGPTVIRDKYWHLLEFFVLAGLLLRAFKAYQWRGAYYFAVLFTMLYGGLDEIHQFFVPGRVLSVLDLGFNSAGAALVLIFKKIW